MLRLIRRPVVAAGDLRNVVADSYWGLSNMACAKGHTQKCSFIRRSTMLHVVHNRPVGAVVLHSYLCEKTIGAACGFAMFAALSKIPEAVLITPSCRQLRIGSCHHLLCSTLEDFDLHSRLRSFLCCPVLRILIRLPVSSMFRRGFVIDTMT